MVPSRARVLAPTIFRWISARPARLLKWYHPVRLCLALAAERQAVRQTLVRRLRAEFAMQTQCSKWRAYLVTAAKTLVLLLPCALWSVALFVRSEAPLRALFVTTIIANVGLLVCELAHRPDNKLWRQLRVPAVAAVIALNFASYHWGRAESTPIVD